MFKIIWVIRHSLSLFTFTVFFSTAASAAQNQLGWQFLNQHELTSQNKLCAESIQSYHHAIMSAFPS